LENRALIRAFRLMAQLLELHDENPFKVRAYEGAAAAVDRLDFSLTDLAPAEYTTKGGLGKSAAAAAQALVQTGTFPELQRLQEVTPPGVVEMTSRASGRRKSARSGGSWAWKASTPCARRPSRTASAR
jgi:DNA polymerase (family X)